MTLVAQGVWNPVLLPSCFPYGHSGPCEKPSKKPNEFAKIQVNPTKSDQIKPLFFIPTPNSKILASEQWAHGSRGLSPHQRGSSVSWKFGNSVKGEND